jgi:arylsulfatase A-like enzyme
MSYRNLFFLCFLVATLFSCGNGASGTSEKPNVIVIYTDDQGSVDMNCYGANDLITPNMDALAERGVRFTQMYAPSCYCSPSRAGLLTGRIPVRAGMPSNAPHMKGKAGMPTGEVTIAEMLKGSGYVTGHVGKWHLGYSPETMPNQQGFDYSFGHMAGCIDNYSHFFYWRGPNRHDLWRNGEEVWEDGRFFGDLMVEECVRFIEQNQEGPFFLYWAINMPHYPLQGRAKWRKVYSRMASPRRMYAEFVSTVDEDIGKVLNELDELGLRENTLIVFQSDHGHSVEERTFSGGGSSGVFRGAKGSFFEGGIRVPAIVSLPGTIPEGEVRDQMVTGCDWLPTIAEICEVPLPKVELDGKSLCDVIDSHEAPTPHERFYWQLSRGPRARWAVRKGNWKLLGNPLDPVDEEALSESDTLFLVDLERDIGERRNVAQEHPEILIQLQGIRDEYLRQLIEE